MGKLIEEPEIEILSFLKRKRRAEVKFIEVQTFGWDYFNAEGRSRIVFFDGHLVLQEIDGIPSAFIGEQQQLEAVRGESGHRLAVTERQTSDNYKSVYKVSIGSFQVIVYMLNNLRPIWIRWLIFINNF